MKVISKLLDKFKEKKAQEVDDDINRKRDNFRRELDRLEALAIQAKLQGRNWDDKHYPDNQPS